MLKRIIIESTTIPPTVPPAIAPVLAFDLLGTGGPPGIVLPFLGKLISVFIVVLVSLVKEGNKASLKRYTHLSARRENIAPEAGLK